VRIGLDTQILHPDQRLVHVPANPCAFLRLAGHALREFESILRSALLAPLDVKVEAGLTKQQLKDIEATLKGLGYGESAINRAKNELAPRVNHVDQIKKIVSRLGLASDGDVARNWFAIRPVHRRRTKEGSTVNLRSTTPSARIGQSRSKA
jgi:hypothetical protein